MPWSPPARSISIRTQHTVSADGKFSWMEVECLGACVNAPMLQIGNDFYEDLDGPITEKLIADFRARQDAQARPAERPRTRPSRKAAR